ncbi:unnamed protein product, partial [Polarella glacialis]
MERCWMCSGVDSDCCVVCGALKSSPATRPSESRHHDAGAAEKQAIATSSSGSHGDKSRPSTAARLDKHLAALDRLMALEASHCRTVPPEAALALLAVINNNNNNNSSNNNNNSNNGNSNNYNNSCTRNQNQPTTTVAAAEETSP